MLTLAYMQTFLSKFQIFFLLIGMNLNKRELNEHVEFESQTYYAAFAAELEACAQPMWGLLSHCKVKVSPGGVVIISPTSSVCFAVDLPLLMVTVYVKLSPNRRHKNILRLWCATAWRLCRSGSMP